MIKISIMKMWATKKEILASINLINETFGSYESYSGGCLKYFLILKKMYPIATAYYDSKHIIAKIGTYFYDKNGLVKNTDGFLPANEYGRAYFNGAFMAWKHLFKYKDLL